MSFNSLAELRGSRGNFDTLMKEVDKINNPSDNRDDDRFWQPEVDKVGNGYAVIRFLPAPKGEDMPWVRIWSHGFKGPSGKWYFENSLTTLGKPDPVTDMNTELWNSGIEANINLVKTERKRRLSYTANVLVIQDPAHPENNGKVKLFKFGKKIFDKITDVMKPEFPGEEPINPFDFWKGANFELKIRKVDGFRNYDKSEFKSTSPIAADDASIEAIWNQESSLVEFLDAKHFKSYDELKKKLDSVLGAPGQKAARAEDTELDNEEFVPSTPTVATSSTSAPGEEDDDAMSYFANLANGN